MGERLGVTPTAEDEALLQRSRGAAEALKDYLATSDTVGGLDAARLAALTEEWERSYTTQKAQEEQFDARIAQAEDEAKARMERGESPVPTPSSEELDALLTELDIKPDDELEQDSERRYYTNSVTHAADKLRKHHELAALAEGLDAPEVIAKREKRDAELAAAWKAYKAENAAKGETRHLDDRFGRYLTEHHPDLDVTAVKWGDKVTREVLASNARDQKNPRPRQGIRPAFGADGVSASFIRADRVAEVVRAHQSGWTPTEYDHGHDGDRDVVQAVSVSDEVYTHGGKAYHLVQFAGGKDIPANACYALPEAVSEYRQAQANGFKR